MGEMTLRERVARAIAPKAWDWYGRIGDSIAQENRRKASLKQATRAIDTVLAAMDEPTEGMWGCAIDAYILAATNPTPPDVRAASWPLKQFWRAMLCAFKSGVDNPSR